MILVERDAQDGVLDACEERSHLLGCHALIEVTQLEDTPGGAGEVPKRVDELLGEGRRVALDVHRAGSMWERGNMYGDSVMPSVRVRYSCKPLEMAVIRGQCCGERKGTLSTAANQNASISRTYRD